MRVKVIAVTQNGNSSMITIQMDHRQMPDFIYSPPTDEVKNDPTSALLHCGSPRGVLHAAGLCFSS